MKSYILQPKQISIVSWDHHPNHHLDVHDVLRAFWGLATPESHLVIALQQMVDSLILVYSDATRSKQNTFI